MISTLLPTWTSIHPLVVHFPIALALVAPFCWAAFILRPSFDLFEKSTLVLIWGAALGSYLAVASGEASAVAFAQPALDQLIEEHEELGELTRGLLTISALVLSGAFVLPRWGALGVFRKRRWALLGTRFVALAALLASAGALSVAAHHGGQLVHKYGLHVLMS